MNKLKKNIRPLLKWIIAGLAAANLILLFVFNYDVPFLDFSNSKQTKITETDTEIDLPEAPVTETASLTINFSDEVLSYDGSSDLDLLSGVSVTDASGAAVGDIPIFTAIKAGKTRKDKIIEYSVTDENGNRIAAERTLVLGDNYTGPHIEVLGELPFISDEELNNIVAILLSSNQLKAEDGFGKDISTSVTSAINSEADLDGNAVISLSVTNVLNDSFTINVNVSTKIIGPTIKLTTDQVTLNVGDNFSFYEYIDFAVDDDGTDLSYYISVEGNVDTSTPGEYELSFFCNDGDGNISPRKTLTVIIQ